MTTGHVFVVKGTIGKLGADAAIVSTDDEFLVEPYWNDVVTSDRPFVPDRHRPAGWSQRGWGQDAAGGQIWFLDVTAAQTGAVDAFDRLRLLLTDITNAKLTSRVKGRPLPLVVLPVIGTKGGGFSHQRGTVIDRLLTVCREFVSQNVIDVAIVARNRASFAALQHSRRNRADTYFAGVDLAAAAESGRAARDGSLALFIGAGTSIPAGAPSWDDLLKILARKAKLGKGVRRGFKRLSPLDQAELLHARLGERLGATVQDLVRDLQPALAHVLLANLNCQSAVTTNYDRLYEDAVGSTGDTAATVLPNCVPPAGSRWLLKMHGDLEDARSIVLTRGQFVGFTGVSGPAGAVLQSLLLTKHLLVVGTSMKDDNFLRLIHEVAAYRKRSKEPGKGRNGTAVVAEFDKFGTIISLDDDPARRELHASYFNWKSMPGDGVPECARELEIYLDAVAMYAAGDNSWLLDESFDYLLDETQRELAAKARALAKDIRRNSEPTSAWAALADHLDGFGAASRPRDGSLASAIPAIVARAVAAT